MIYLLGCDGRMVSALESQCEDRGIKFRASQWVHKVKSHEQANTYYCLFCIIIVLCPYFVSVLCKLFYQLFFVPPGIHMFSHVVDQ